MTIALFSCSKEDIQNVQNSEATEILTKNFKSSIIYPSIKDNRLHFNNFDDFEVFMRGISSEQPDYIEELNNSYGFLSYDSVLNYDDEFLDLPPLDFNNSADFIIDDPYLASVLNHNREVSVGNIICRVENEYVFLYVDGYFNETSEFKNSGKTIEYNTAEVINDKLIAYRPQIDGEYQVKAWIAGYES